MNNEIKPGDFVRLTDPFSNGQIVRIESVDEHGFASWLGGSQNCDMEQINVNVQIGDCLFYISLSNIIGEIEQGCELGGINIKLYPESAVEFWKQRAEKAEESIVKFKDYVKKVCKESSDDIQKLDAENKKLKQELARCRAANADYLTAKTETENRAKLLEKEVADLKVPESRQNRHLRDELHKVRLECQQAWEAAEKERKRYNEVKKDILTLVSLIPCNEGNESIINDIKALLK